MRYYRATWGGRREADGHGIMDDDTVSTAARRLESMFGGPVHMWCRRRVDAHEALAIAVAGTVHLNQEYDADLVCRELAARLGARVSPREADSPERLLSALKKGGRLFEQVSMRSRMVIPGGYFAVDNADPYARGAIGTAAAEKNRFPYRTGGLLMESFGADEVYFTTRADVERGRAEAPASAAEWAKAMDWYFPPIQDEGLPASSDAAVKEMARQRRVDDSGDVHLLYVPVVGGAPVGRVGTERLLAVFKETRTTMDLPMIRIRTSESGGTLSRVHESASDDVLSYTTPPRQEWLQAHLLGGKGSAVLTVLPNGTYKMQVRFSYLDGATEADAVGYMERCNELLMRVSAFIRPMSERSLMMSSSVFGQKPHLLETPCVLGGPRTGLYQMMTIDVPGAVDIVHLADAVRRHGFPSIKAVNVKNKELHGVWMRSACLGKAAIVKSLAMHEDSGAGWRELAKELGMTKDEMVSAAEGRLGRFTAVTHFRVRKASDVSLLLIVNGTDVSYGTRVRQALRAALRAAGDDRGGKRGDLWAGSVGSSPMADDGFDAPSSGGMDEFFEMLDDDEYNPADAAAGERGVARPSSGAPNVLDRLKRSDPEVFAFPGTKRFSPYSTRCQKSSGYTRQPIVLTDGEMAAAMKGSTGTGMEALDRRLIYRGKNYVCPEKWCPVSGVAVGASEHCPAPGESGWAIWNHRHPGLQSGATHPKGLCMPCCFGKPPAEGSSTMNVILDCGGEVNPDPTGRAGNKVGRKRHINREERALDKGALGRAPASLGANALRVGIGARNGTSLAAAVAYVLGMKGGEKELKSTLADALMPEHFVQGNVREFHDVESDGPAGRGRVAGWATPAYAAIMGRKTSSRVHEMVMAAHGRCVSAMRSGGAVSDASMLRFLNSGALPDIPAVYLVSVDGPEPVAEHVQSGALFAPGKGARGIAVLMKRNSVIEPLVPSRPRRGGALPLWDAGMALPETIAAGVRRALPSGVKRVVSMSMMAVGTTTASGGYLPYSRPVFIDPGHKHVIFADAGGPLPPATDEEAAAALRETGDEFYRDEWRRTAAAAWEDFALDGVLFGSGRTADPRDVIMDRIIPRLKKAEAIASAAGRARNQRDFAPVAGESARETIARVRAAVLESAAAEAAGAEDHVIDLAADILARRLPVSVDVSIDVHGDERLVYS